MGFAGRVGSSAISLLALAPLFVATPSFAQYSTFADQALEAAGLSTGPLDRSPGLAAMGRLSLVGSDPHYRLTLWDFAGNPAGVGTADSVSTLDIRPGNSGGSDVHGIASTPLQQIAQTFAARGSDFGFEMWRRAGALAYGTTGNIGALEYDHPFSDAAERRVTLGNSTVTPVIAGILPYTHSGRTRYALRMHWSQENVDTRYLAIVQNAAGSFISLDSELLDPPNVFLPESYSVHQVGGGLAVSQSFGPLATFAIGYDGVSARIEGDSPQKRSGAQTHESRPFDVVQSSAVGRVGTMFEWGVDNQLWKSTSQTDWDFSISAGQGANPLTGRGKLLDREEVGEAFRTRAVLHVGAFDLGAGAQTLVRRVDITPPASNDRTSLNYFINTTYYRTGADSLALPDSVARDRSQRNAWEAGGGIAMHLPHHRGIVGIEYHRLRQLDQTWLGGQGPRREGWDVRGGMDYRCAPAMVGRAGYQFSHTDEDRFTQGNEYLSHLMTLGVGVSPATARWVFDLSYGIRWVRADYGSPAQPRGSRQQLASQVHWSF